MPQEISGNQEISFRVALFIAFLCVLFGANAVAIKISLSGMGPFTIAWVRFSMASVAVTLWARWGNRSLALRRDQFLKIAVISVVFTAQLSLFYLGLERSNASRGTLIVNILPFLVLLLAHFVIPGERISIRKLAGMLLGFSGVVFVFLDKGTLGSDLRLGDCFILCATFIWACNTVYIKKIIDGFQPFQLVLYPMLISIPLFFLEAFLFDEPVRFPLENRVLLSLLYQGFVTASFGFVAWNTMLRKYGATNLHSFVFIMPMAGVFLGGFMLGEPVSWKIIAALVMIAAGIFVVHKKGEPKVPYHPSGRPAMLFFQRKPRD